MKIKLKVSPGMFDLLYVAMLMVAFAAMGVILAYRG